MTGMAHVRPGLQPLS